LARELDVQACGGAAFSESISLDSPPLPQA
jgi:hypothetical protein